MRRLILVLLVVGAASTVWGGGPGDLVLIGGGEKPGDAMRLFVELAGGRGAPIVVFPTASSQPDTGEYYRSLFADEYGCDVVHIAEVHGRENAADPEIARIVAEAGGIFFGGGDQRRITAALLGTRVGEAVRAAWESGVVVGGTSAGTACMSALMITGDGDFTVLREHAVETSPGWGFFSGVIVDQHFVARARFNRLLNLVLEHPKLVGVGIDEGTAVHVEPGGTFRVLGGGWVVVIDARAADTSRRDATLGANLGGWNVRLHVLQPGDRFDPWAGGAVGGSDR